MSGSGRRAWSSADVCRPTMSPPFDTEGSRIAGQPRAKLGNPGSSVPVLDAMIASTVLRHGSTPVADDPCRLPNFRPCSVPKLWPPPRLERGWHLATRPYRICFAAGNPTRLNPDFTGTINGPINVARGKLIPPAGQRSQVKFCAVATWNGTGEIARERFFYDPASFMKQIGLS